MTLLPARVAGLLILVGLCALSEVDAAAQRQATRLVVTNQTGAVIELSQLVKQSWQSRGRVSAGASLPVYNVTNGDEFRAEWRGGRDGHIVKLQFDRSFGVWQDAWTVLARR